MIIIDPKSGQIRPRTALSDAYIFFLKTIFIVFLFEIFCLRPISSSSVFISFFVLLFFYSEKLAIDFVGSCLSKIGQIKPENNLNNSLDKSCRNVENLGPKMSGLYFGPPVKVARI